MKRYWHAALGSAVFLFLWGCGGPRPEEQADSFSSDAGVATARRAGEPALSDRGGRDEAAAPEASAADSSPIATEEQLRAALREKNPGFGGELGVQTDGRNIVAVGLSDPAVEEIAPLAGLPLQRLELSGCHVTDIRPLEGMPLGVLGLERTGVRDIGVLKGMPLTVLALSHTRVDDIGPLAGAPLEELYLVRTAVTDLSPLAGMPRLQSLWLNDTPVSDIAPLASVPSLVSLTLAGTKVADLSPLKGLRISRLHIARTEVTDLEPLKWLKLQRLVFTPGKIEKGIEAARNMPTLREIGTSFGEEAEGREDNMMPPDVFWERYDAGAFE